MSASTIMDTITIAAVFAILGFGVFLSFKILNITDLTVEASYALGAAITGMICKSGVLNINHNILPFLAIICAMLGGAFAGIITALLHTKLKINSVLAGILTLTAFYTINLLVIKKDGFSYTSIGLSGNKGVTLFTLTGNGEAIKMVVMVLIALLVGVLLALFFKTRLGLSIRACGDNEQMTKTQCISTDKMKIIGLAISNALVAFAGSLFVMQQASFATSMEKGMMVVGVATIIIGEVVVFRTHNLNIMLVGIFIGSLIYRFIYAIALRIDFINTEYLHLITASLIVLIMLLSRLASDYKKRKNRNNANLDQDLMEVESND